MILNCQNLSKSFGDNEVFSNVSFHIEDNEKAALVGSNGAGKSTLLKIITGELEPDSGQCVLSRDKTMGYLSQQPLTDLNMTVYQAMEDAKKDIISLGDKIRQIETDMKSAEGEKLKSLMDSYSRLTHEFEYKNGYSYKSEIRGLLAGLKFPEEDWDKNINDLSGGQKTRVALGRILLSHPDLIILDEPTNHLDIESISWLEGFLSSYRGAVLVVSHDRYFLDRFSTKVIDLYMHRARVYSGNYTQFAEKKQALFKDQMNAYLNQQREIAHQEQVIGRLKQFNREKSIKRAESREKMLDKIDRIEKPVEENVNMRITLTPAIISGNDVLSVRELKKGFDSHDLFADLSFEIKRGEKVALIGRNGTGKTTILKILNHQVMKDAGEIRLGAKVKIGYYDQAQQLLNDENTVFGEISDAYPDMDNTRIRNTLAAFLFTGEDVFKKISSLSGGERGRLSLAKLMLSKANFLILDEPTNHLDIYSKEILEEALKNYTGTLLYVSHDRYFVNRTATRILELADKKLTEYKGNYDYYLEQKAARLQAAEASAEQSGLASSPSESESGTKEDWKAAKALAAKQRKLENAIAKAEENINHLEKELEELQNKMSDPEISTDSEKLMELSSRAGDTQKELDSAYEEWEKLSEQQEQ